MLSRLKVVVTTVCALIALLLAFVGGRLLESIEAQHRMDSVIATSWGDGKYGKAFYGAIVLTEARAPGLAIRLVVQCGQGNGMYHDCGVIGTAADHKDAVARWSQIAWQSDGLHVGMGPGAYFLPQATLENHR
jgi:hypothetical protein